MVSAQRRVYERYDSIESRNRYEGIGEGGDRTLMIDRLCEDEVFAELEAATAATGGSLLAISEERGEIAIGPAGGAGGGAAPGGPGGDAASGGPGGGAATAGTADEAVRVVIDPIDGSLNARRTVPSYSLSLAVASGPSMADVEFGYVYDFGAAEEYMARRGQGATRNGTPLALNAGPPAAEPAGAQESPPSGDGRAMELVGLEAADPALAAPAMAALADHVHRLRVVGSIAITACLVAAGRLDGMFSLRPCRSVDIAAAQLIVTEAGGEVSLAPEGPAASGLGLAERYPVTAAASRANLEILLAAQ